MRLLFLDIDGVLNTHVPHERSQCCGIDADLMHNLNEFLTLTRAKLVISSSWRYLIHSKSMTIDGFRYLLHTHGLDHKVEIHGITCTDEHVCELDGTILRTRFEQIDHYLKTMNFNAADPCNFFAIVDDLAPGALGFYPHFQYLLDRFVQTDFNVGLTFEKRKELEHKMLGHTFDETKFLQARSQEGDN